MNLSGIDEAIERSHRACAAFVNGDPEPLKKAYSHRDDVTVANPFGPPAHGWKQVEETIERAAANWHGGTPEGFDLVTRYESAELAFTVEIERYRAKVGDRTELAPVALRVTQVYRPEDGIWKIMHRHADHITTARTAESVVSK
ncbi:MAG: nuclear transport factor 2 family protein [Actinomycetota bacterium]